MSVTIADTTFDRVRYDEDADVLYLHSGDPAKAVEFDESPEGHHLRFGADGHLSGITIVRPAGFWRTRRRSRSRCLSRFQSAARNCARH
jgi:uncharacterized protein YuzE